MFNIIKMCLQPTLENPIMQTKTVDFKLLKFKGFQTNYSIIFGNNIDLPKETLKLDRNRCCFELLKCLSKYFNLTTTAPA